MRTIINLIKRVTITCPECGHKQLLENCTTNEEKLMQELVYFGADCDYTERKIEREAEARAEERAVERAVERAYEKSDYDLPF